jgi:hypothetical protein
MEGRIMRRNGISDTVGHKLLLRIRVGLATVRALAKVPIVTFHIRTVKTPIIIASIGVFVKDVVTAVVTTLSSSVVLLASPEFTNVIDEGVHTPHVPFFPQTLIKNKTLGTPIHWSPILELVEAAPRRNK